MIRPVLAALAVALVLTGCGEEAAEDVPTADGAPERSGAAFAIRPVIGDADGTGCDPGLAPEESGVLCDLDGLAIDVGPAGVVDGVVSARAVELREDAWGVEIELDAAAAAALEQLTQEVASSDGRIAVIVAGEIVSAPTVAGVIGAGTVQVAGDWSEQVAADLAARARTGS